MSHDAHGLCEVVSSAPSSALKQNAPYNSALSRAASASTASLWSDAASQSSDDTSLSTKSTDSDSSEYSVLPKQDCRGAAQDYTNYRRSLHQYHSNSYDPVPTALRQNPRRSAHGSHAGRMGLPPALVRQTDRKVNFVDSLVDSSTQIVEAIWPLSAAVCRSELGSKAVLPLRTFIQETLRRSRTSYSTLQVALYYLVLIRPHVPKHDSTTEQPHDLHADRALQCGRRMFLAALILASKYLQDRNYSARAWSKISGLKTQEINQNEIAFLLAIDWKLHIAEDVFQRWTEIVLKLTPIPSPPSSPSFTALPSVAPARMQQFMDWKQLILKLDPQLTNIGGLSSRRFARMQATDSGPLLPPRATTNPARNLRGPIALDEGSDEHVTPRTHFAPAFMEPSLSCASAVPCCVTPAVSLLPIPRLTSQIRGFGTPAASAGSQVGGKHSAMSLAWVHAGADGPTQTTFDRLHCSINRTSQGACPVRRSSLAISIMSTASSPESMVSDSSQSSRSSSISSASSLASATLYYSPSRTGVPLRPRVSKKNWSQGPRLKPVMPSILDPPSPISSSDASMRPGITRMGDLVADDETVKTGEWDFSDAVPDPARDAARTLQHLHSHDVPAEATPTARKRSRASSAADTCLPDDVRSFLTRHHDPTETSWADLMVRSQDTGMAVTMEPWTQAAAPSSFGPTPKRVCCSLEAAAGFQVARSHCAIGLHGRKMWDHILN